MSKISITCAKYSHYSQILDIWNTIISEGKSFFWDKPFDSEFIDSVISEQLATYVATLESIVVGFYILHPNSPGRGSHNANALYGVKSEFRNKGIGNQLCSHSLLIAKELGFLGIIFNSVVKDNIAANKLWKKHGFEVVGEIPDSFRNSNNILVNTYLYYKRL